MSSVFCSNYGILMEITVSMVNLKVYLSSLYGMNFNWRINARTEYQGNTETYFCLIVLSVRTQYTWHYTVQYIVIHISVHICCDYKRRLCTHLLRISFDSVSVNFCHGILEYAHMSMHVPQYIWSFERACVFPPPRLCVSAHMGSFMSQQPRRSLKVTNHFLKWGTSS